MDLRRRVPNPSGIALLAEASGLFDGFVVTAPQERNYFVQPEGLAAVKAFLESPHAESKTYAIVDVGAGTTEVSFFFNGWIMTEPGQPLRPSYLADSTRPVGGGMVDLELAQAWGCTIEDARRRKEAGKTTFPVLPHFRNWNTLRKVMRANWVYSALVGVCLAGGASCPARHRCHLSLRR
jgi:Ethanolamine utilization protein EutJ (predicted chaperonin)